MSAISDFLHDYAPQSGWGTFFTAAFGAFAGAFAASRAQSKRSIIAELNALAAGHEFAVAIANRYLGSKRQHVQVLNDDFKHIQNAYNNHMTMVKNGTAQLQALAFVADFRSLPVQATPSALIEKLLLEKTLLRGRGLAALVTLTGAIDGLKISTEARNELVEECRNRKGWTDKERFEFLLGLRTSAGVIDERMPTNIEALYLQTDDCIFFAKILAADIVRYSNDVRRTEGWSYRLRVPKLRDADWTYPEGLGLMPKESNYEAWLRGFPPTRTRWQHLKERFGKGEVPKGK